MGDFSGKIKAKTQTFISSLNVISDLTSPLLYTLIGSSTAMADCRFDGS